MSKQKYRFVTFTKNLSQIGVVDHPKKFFFVFVFFVFLGLRPSIYQKMRAHKFFVFFLLHNTYPYTLPHLATQSHTTESRLPFLHPMSAWLQYAAFSFPFYKDCRHRHPKYALARKLMSAALPSKYVSS